MITLVIGAVCYLTGLSSLIAFFWMIQFGIPPQPGSFNWSLVIHNTLIFLPFPLQHSLLPRRFIQTSLEASMGPHLIRPFYVGTSGLLLWVVVGFWKPFGPVLYSLPGFFIFDIVFLAALILILTSTMQLDHGSLFGLKQAWAGWKKEPLPQPAFKITGLFSRVRHPITSGLIVALWSHDTLTADRLLLNLLFTAYALIGTIFEEQSLVKNFGSDYLEYRRHVPAFILGLRRNRARAKPDDTTLRNM